MSKSNEIQEKKDLIDKHLAWSEMHWEGSLS